MKKIEVIIKPFKLDDVKDALSKLGVNGMTICEVKGFGRQRGHQEILKFDVAVDAEMADQVIAAIKESGATGKIGYGKIFVMPVEETIRIRTGEPGHNAL